MKRQFTILIPALLAALLLAACAGSPKQPEQTLEERAVARWQHLIDRSPAQAYDYLSPGFKATTTREGYAADIARKPVSWTSVRHIRTTCETEDTCLVVLIVSISVQSNVMSVGRIEGSTNIREDWIRSDGQWYLVPSPS